MVLKFIQTIRNNWKKTIFFSCVGAYGIKYGIGIYNDALLREEYFREALKYGQSPLRLGERARKVTVFLNPAAQKGKAKKLFEKNVAPLLYLAGLEVTVVKTEYEGQAKKYMDVIDTTDAIVVAGGDGTVCEIITGILRRPDHEKMEKIPIGVIPLGNTNTLAKSLAHKGESAVKWMIDLGMSIVNSTTKSIDVMCIQGNEGKPVYAVNSLEWGPYQEAEQKRTKYWYFGPLKHRWAYLMSTFNEWPPNVQAEFDYQKPCEGCSNCYVPPPPIKWKWWHLFVPPRREVPKKDCSKIDNPDCGKDYSSPVDAIEFSAETNNRHIHENQETQALNVIIGPNNISKSEFIKEGWSRIKNNRNDEHNKQIKASVFTLNPNLKQNEEAWYIIDNEQFEAMPVEVKLLRNKLNVFCPKTFCS